MVAAEFTANFDGTTDFVVVPFTGIASNSPTVIAGDPIISTTGQPFVSAYIDGEPTASGCTVRASAPFVGQVNLLVIG